MDDDIQQIPLVKQVAANGTYKERLLFPHQCFANSRTNFESRSSYLDSLIE